MDERDFKFILSQAFKWYQTSTYISSGIAESEKNQNVFNDAQSDKFQTKSEKQMFTKASRGSSFKEFTGFDTGGIQPDVAMLREFGLPVPE